MDQQSSERQTPPAKFAEGTGTESTTWGRRFFTTVAVGVCFVFAATSIVVVDETELVIVEKLGQISCIGRPRCSRNTPVQIKNKPPSKQGIDD